jgi:hypothetical protein
MSTTRRSRKRRAGGSMAELQTTSKTIISLRCKDCFFGFQKEIKTTKATRGKLVIECRWDSPTVSKKADPVTGQQRQFPLMEPEKDFCGCFRPINPKCLGQVHCEVPPHLCNSSCQHHIDHGIMQLHDPDC